MTVKLNVRSPQFSNRLVKACDEAVDCPPLHKGRLTWLRDRLGQAGFDVTVESVRRWLSGQGRPTQDKCTALAGVLGVDAVYLYMGRSSNEQAGVGLKGGEVDQPDAATPSFNIPLRPGITVAVIGLPFDLTSGEAARLANIMRAYAPENR